MQALKSMEYNDVVNKLQHYKLTPDRLNYLIKFKLQKKNTKNTKTNAVKKENNASSKAFMPIYKDTLFWCFYLMKYGFSQYETIGNQYFVEEKQKKFEYIQMLRCNKDVLKMNKIRPLSSLEDELSNNATINIKTFFALCIVGKINVVLVDGNKYYESINNDDTQIHIVKKCGDKFFLDLDVESSVDLIRDNKYKMTCFDSSGLKSISSYKVDDLTTLINKLGITIPDSDKKKTKKEYYDALHAYFV